MKKIKVFVIVMALCIMSLVTGCGRIKRTTEPEPTLIKGIEVENIETEEIMVEHIDVENGELKGSFEAHKKILPW